MDNLDNLNEFELHEHKLPDRYRQIISQNQQSKYIKLGKRFRKIPKHIFWWKATKMHLKNILLKNLI